MALRIRNRGRNDDRVARAKDPHRGRRPAPAGRDPLNRPEIYGAVEPTDRRVAERFYPPEDRSWLPDQAVRSALGVGNPVSFAELRPGEDVVDLGSGGGIDCLLAARAVGPAGSVIGVDFLEDAVTRARTVAVEAGLDNVRFIVGEIEDLPLTDESVDVVISNGVPNLSPRKSRVMAEAFRVLRPGGRLAIVIYYLKAGCRRRSRHTRRRGRAACPARCRSARCTPRYGGPGFAPCRSSRSSPSASMSARSTRCSRCRCSICYGGWSRQIGSTGSRRARSSGRGRLGQARSCPVGRRTIERPLGLPGIPDRAVGARQAGTSSGSISAAVSVAPVNVPGASANLCSWRYRNPSQAITRLATGATLADEQRRDQPRLVQVVHDLADLQPAATGSEHVPCPPRLEAERHDDPEPDLGPNRVNRDTLAIPDFQPTCSMRPISPTYLSTIPWRTSHGSATRFTHALPNRGCRRHQAVAPTARPARAPKTNRFCACFCLLRLSSIPIGCDGGQCRADRTACAPYTNRGWSVRRLHTTCISDVGPAFARTSSRSPLRKPDGRC